MTNEPCTKIVIDAANLIHDDRGIEKTDENGEHVIQMIPQRLVSAVEICTERGYEVIALLKHGTYTYGIIQFKANNPEYSDFASIIQLKEKGIVKLIDSKEDDLFIVEHGLNQNALILTRDWFNDHRENRSDIDWDKVDTLRINEYSFIENVFTCPTIKGISNTSSNPKSADPIDEIKDLLNAQSKEIEALKLRVHELEERDISKEIAAMSKKEIENAAIQVKKDSSRAKSPEACAEAYLKLTESKKLSKPKKKSALRNDLLAHGLASEMGAGLVMHHLQKLKAIHVNKNSVVWRV